MFSNYRTYKVCPAPAAALTQPRAASDDQHMLDSKAEDCATEFTAQTLRQALDFPELQPGDVIEPDQRRSPRTPLDLRATLLPFSEQFSSEPLVVPLRDLSPGGFRFLHDRQLPLGQQFALLLPEASSRPIVILCTVAYWQPLAKDLFAIGAKFCQVLRQGELGLPLVLEDALSGELTTRKAS